ncbi:MAG: DUF2961 domain-containing protein, partial [Armatimonadetes bacterium]|nr:DUF2961 domain-containing protein [Armatimonadota bacterium]
MKSLFKIAALVSLSLVPVAARAQTAFAPRPSFAAPVANAPVSTLGAGSLGNLMFPRAGKMAHYSSYERNGGNADFRVVPPGETLTLVDHQGAGVVRRWWLTIAPFNNVELQRQGIIRCYWDGETTPSVEVPVSDFFGMGFGQWRDYISLPLNMTSGGYNCYWPMPFKRSARITFQNTSKRPVTSFYYNVDVETLPSLPPETLYFHAQFRRTVTEAGKPVTILNATGKGHYVGTLLSMQPLRSRSELYLEGDEQITIDGETRPSYIGTGTEDYFSSGWYYNTGVYSAPYHGVTITKDPNARINTYRWHIEDPIPFERSLRFEMEHGPRNDTPGVDYSSVAYWYQTHPRAPFPALPRDLMPPPPPVVARVAGMIEAELLPQPARASRGVVERQDMAFSFNGQWSNEAQLWWREGQPGDTLRLVVDAPAAREYELVGYFTRAVDYGDFRLSVNGRQVGPLVSGYGTGVVPSGPISFGRVAMKSGANEIVLTLTGK